MMHEHVSYHTRNQTVNDIQKKYRDGVLECATGWFEELRRYLPEHEIINYIISLYYDRNMVSMASLIAVAHREAAYCPGVEVKDYNVIGNPALTGVKGVMKVRADEINKKKLWAFVSEDCPVSMVDTVMKARRLADTETILVVVPQERLNDRHKSIRRMVSGGVILFVDDEQWRTKFLPKR
jgi:hypothetical protein